MIDKNKIAKAARKCLAAFRKANPDGYSSSIIDIESNCLKNFKDGAKWAINEFQMDLWHPASEAPKRRFNYLLLHYKDKEEECFEADVVDTKAWDCYIKGSLVEYINIDDLFPKEGGEQ